MPRRICCLLVLLLPRAGAAGDLGARTPLLVGMAETMTVDVTALDEVLEGKFAAIMKEFTGLAGQLKIAGSPFDLARKLEDRAVHVAVFQGVEYAWVREKYPEFRPLMVAINQHPHPRAQLLVSKKAAIKGPEDLRGLTLAYPKKCKEHCRLFLERLVGKAAPKDFFKEVTQPKGVEAALDDLLAGKTQAVLADKTLADFYEYLKPGAYKQLQVLETSEAFPATVIVCREGVLDARTLDRFRSGMLKANKSERGRELMGEFNMTAFEPVPADYDKTLAAILKAYPPPKDGK